MVCLRSMPQCYLAMTCLDKGTFRLRLLTATVTGLYVGITEVPVSIASPSLRLLTACLAAGILDKRECM